MENQIVIYQADNGQTSIDVRLESETVWLTQAQMAELFQKDQSVIARHIANVFKEGELERNSNMQILHNTLSKYKPTAIYNLDVIISVGYRVKSQRGVDFRKWANRVLKEYLWSPRTIRSVMETSVLPPPCFCGSSTTMASFTARMAANALPTTLWSP